MQFILSATSTSSAVSTKPLNHSQAVSSPLQHEFVFSFLPPLHHQYLRRSEQLGTSIGLALTSTIATAASARYHAAHPDLPADSPGVLMVGFRAAGWTCFAAAGVAFCIAAFGLRNIGVVGKTTQQEDGDVLVRTPTPQGGKP